MNFATSAVPASFLSLLTLTAAPASADYVITTWQIGKTFRVNEVTGVATVLDHLHDGGSANNIARSPSGEVYVTSRVTDRNDRLYRLNLDTGLFSPVPIQLDIADIRALTFRADGVLFAATHVPSTNTRLMHTIDLQTGHATQIATMPNTPIQGMTFLADGTIMGVGPWYPNSRVYYINPATFTVTRTVSMPDTTAVQLQDVTLLPSGVLLAVDATFASGGTPSQMWAVNQGTGALTPWPIGLSFTGAPINDFRGVTWIPALCGTADYDKDGDTGTDRDIEAFFACLAGQCCPACTADFDGDGESGTDADIQSFFSVLAGRGCVDQNP